MRRRKKHAYCVHAREEGRHRTHEVWAANAADAAVAFVERWLPESALQAGEVAIEVEDVNSGERACLTIDLDTGEAAVCD